jgi:predicted Zn-dependent protease
VLLLAALGPCFPQGADPAALSRQAKEAMTSGRYADAARLYRQLLKLYPEDHGLKFNLGLAEFQSGSYRGAIPLLEAAVKGQPKLAPAWLILGMAHLKLDETRAAVIPLERSLSLDPHNPLTRFELADALLSLNRFAEAIVHFQALADLDPRDSRAWYGLGRSHLGLMRQAFDRLEQTAPGSLWHSVLLARSRLEQQQFGSAHYYYRQALAASPSMRGVHAALAEVYHRTGHADWAEVEESRERMLPKPDCRQFPLECDFQSQRFSAMIQAAGGRGDAESLYWVSQAHSALARQAYERLASLPPSAVSHRLAAEILNLQERHQEAAVEWREALRLDPSNYVLELELARSLMHAEDHSGALPVLEALARRPSPSSEILFLLGQCLLSLQEPARAVPSLERAVKMNPANRSARSALGRALLQNGQPTQAIPHLESALPSDKDGNLHYLLAQAYIRAGKRQAATRALSKREELSRAAAEQAAERERNYKVTAPP